MRVVDSGSKPAAVIIDIDGTIYDRRYYVDAMLEIVERMFMELHQLSRNEAVTLVRPLRESMANDWSSISSTAFVLRNGFSASEWADYRNEYLHRDNKIETSPHVVEEIRRLHRHLPIGFLTNNARVSADRVLTAIGLMQTEFDTLVCAEDTKTSPKPDRTAFELAALRLSAPITDCWSIGDRYEIDVAPLVALGGSGIEVSGPAELTSAFDHLISLTSQRLARTS